MTSSTLTQAQKMHKPGTPWLLLRDRAALLGSICPAGQTVYVGASGTATGLCLLLTWSI